MHINSSLVTVAANSTSNTTTAIGFGSIAESSTDLSRGAPHQTQTCKADEAICMDTIKVGNAIFRVPVTSWCVSLVP